MKGLSLLGAFHALGDRHEVEAVGEAHDARHQLVVGRRRAEAVDEAAVDLEDVERDERSLAAGAAARCSRGCVRVASW